MATLIKNKRIAPDSWQLLSPAVDGGLSELPQSGDWIVPLTLWQAKRAAHGGRIGVLLENTDDPRVLAEDFDKLALIAVRFPKFTDGRGYSIARLLRRMGWQGELRAVGDVLRDQLFYMTRCGFDAFALRDDQDPQVALSAFGDFTAPYQAAVDDGARLGSARAPSKPAASALSPW
ncbi:MAG: DUF934 domain-containing protein [Betaproteobacteria bacterium]|nr:DUF934 domain-containing protein [Betaproteobacteria bacterium]